jgi:glycosyltransferase involved in cell wall biosynthesis
MRIALIVPGGVDRSLEYRVIPALLALIERLSRDNEVRVFALKEPQAEWALLGASVQGLGSARLPFRALREIYRQHKVAPFDVVQSIWSGACGLIAVLSAKLLGLPSLVHVGGGELVSMPEIGYGGMRTRMGRLRELRVLRGASRVTAASSPVIEALAAWGVPAQRIPLGVDLEEWPPRQPARRIPGRVPKLIHVASLNQVKDQATLLRAAAALRKLGTAFEMDIIGEDTLDGEIQELAARLELMPVVRFRGFMTQRQMRPLVEEACLMIHSSRHETGPVVVLEAAVAGVPTVGTAVGHIAEWAPDGAVSVPVGDWNSLAAAVRQLLEDEDLRLRIAGEAHRRALRESADYTARSFNALYKDLVS